MRFDQRPELLHPARPKHFPKESVRLLLVAKFVPGLDGVYPPLAGMLGASLASFVLYDAGGSLLWAGAYIFGGFFFARQLDVVAQQLAVAANVLMVVLGIPLLVMFFLAGVRSDPHEPVASPATNYSG